MNLISDINSFYLKVKKSLSLITQGKHNLPLLSMFCGAGLLLTGCIDETFPVDDPVNPGVEIEGDCIQFTMALDKDISSRVADYSHFSDSEATKYENYIDTQDKFRVFFFTEDGDFLFGATDRVLGGISSSGSTGYWYVRIPMTMIVDREGAEYDIDKIKSYLKNNPFKIAVLANWPNAGEKVNPADWDDSEGTNSSGDNPSSTLKGHPQWNWSNSILNKDAKPKDIRNINDLHHVFNDTYYAGATRYQYYSQFMDDAKPGDEPGFYMGEPTDWVKMRDINEGWKVPSNQYAMSTLVDGFDSKVTANQWIRANWSPDVLLNQGKNIYRHYQHLWLLWNFDATYKTALKGVTYKKADGSETSYLTEAVKDANGNYTVGTVTDASAYTDNWGWNDGNAAVNNRFGAEWYKRNGDILYQWMKASYNNGTKLPLADKMIDIGEATNDVFFRYIPNISQPGYCVKINDNYGIQLPAVNTSKVNDASTGMMKFQARTSGTIRIKWGSADDRQASLAVQRDMNTTPYVHENLTSANPTDWTYNNLNYIDVSVEGNSVPMYIYCTKGNAVIYAIEYIRGRYLYETDREGVAPNINQGIPMYGVQRYEPIGDWQRGTTITLTENVSLIRALAKVEVFIKKEFGKPRHVYMRNINRAARCEPMDVETPTDEIWSEKHASVTNNGDGKDPTVEKLCEWFDIQQYGPSYGSSGSYSDWLSWFYGSWKNTKWKTGNDAEPYRYDWDLGYWVPMGSHKGWKNDLPKADDKSPRFFNPYNYRNDFCRFLEGDDTGYTDDEYYHYVLYLPEKNIDDPSTIGELSSDPHVPHIEYRFYPKDVDPLTDKVEGYVEADLPYEAADDRYSNTEYNLDDNQSYRIYFTNYGKSGPNSENVNDVTKVNAELISGRWNRDTYDNYERNREYLEYHWPIMRNHIYKFYVGGDGPQNPEVLVEVADWGHRKVVVKW